MAECAARQAVVASFTESVLVLQQVRALATQILLRPDLAEERAKLILETIEKRPTAGDRMLAARNDDPALSGSFAGTKRTRNPEDFSDRQRSVVALMATGATTREIGECLNLSNSQVSDALKKVGRKLGLSSVSKANVLAEAKAIGLHEYEVTAA